MLVVESPTIVRLVGYEDRAKDLNRILTYHDKKVDYEIQKFKNSHWFLQRHGEEAFIERLDELKSQRIKSLLFEDEKGLYTYTGLAQTISEHFNDEIRFDIEYPETDCIPWLKKPRYEPRPFQKQAVERMIEARHASVELATGLGKTFCILLLAKHFGRKTIIMAPSTSIAKQILGEFVEHFGRKYVGQFFDGKKDYKKLFIVAISNSLVNVKEGSEAWDHLSKAAVLIGDESHLLPASTLAEVCFGLAKNVPYRFFFSGTQIRNDGLDTLLNGIIGPVVLRMGVQEGVDSGYLAKPLFRMVKISSKDGSRSPDPNNETRKHLYYNPTVNRAAALLANEAVLSLGHQTLILVDEVEQFAHLLPHLKVKPHFAHGTLNKENKEKVPAAYHASDPTALVKGLNDGEFSLLVGTSCVATGTDFTSVKTIIYLMGGKSEIQLKQAIGRGTRMVEDKTEFYFWDFDVANKDVPHRHALSRIRIMADVYPSLEMVDF